MYVDFITFKRNGVPTFYTNDVTLSPLAGIGFRIISGYVKQQNRREWFAILIQMKFIEKLATRCPNIQ